jgi:DNA-binding SARP family transcriptional activator
MVTSSLVGAALVAAVFGAGSVAPPGGGVVVAGWQRGGSGAIVGNSALSGGCVVHYAHGMRFRVLGPLEVEADDGPVVLGGPKERLLLALLLTRPNQVVAVEALLRGLWGEQPPPTAAKTLQSHVMRLRRALELGRARGAAGQVLVTRGPGYLLRVAPGALDAARFEELTSAARRALSGGAPDMAGSMLGEALGLWRGQAFEEFLDSEFGAAEADRLGELRLVAVEDRVEADLRLGRHRELVAELEGLVREHPLRERLWAQLLLALYRSGRQADALLAYQRARSILVEELGIDPGAELRRLHAAVLAQDPGLDLRPMAEAAPARELPEALTPAGPAFVGRAADLAWLRAAWTQATQGRGGAAFLVGGPGMGKTRLAAELARQAHDQGGWILHRRCLPEPHGPLRPFEQALTAWDAALEDVPDPGRSPSALGRKLADLLASRSGIKWPKAVAKITDDAEELLTFYDFPAEHWGHLKTSNPIESTFSSVRLRTRVTKGPGSKAAGLAMAFKLLASAQDRWRAVNGPHLVALVRAGARFHKGVMVERPDEVQEVAA